MLIKVAIYNQILIIICFIHYLKILMKLLILNIYCSALPDLPARVLVCPIVRDFFYPSRLESSSLFSAPQSLISHSLPSLTDLKVRSIFFVHHNRFKKVTKR